MLGEKDENKKINITFEEASLFFVLVDVNSSPEEVRLLPPTTAAAQEPRSTPIWLEPCFSLEGSACKETN